MTAPQLAVQNVLIGKQRVQLKQKDVIGSGGEAVVFKVKIGGEWVALKIYHAPSHERAAKLDALIGVVGQLPPAVIGPQALAQDAATNGHTVGFAMRLLDAKYTEVRSLSNRSYRAANGITGRYVGELFAGAHAALKQMHRSGLIVGDLNDLNLMFSGPELIFVDVDSFQFGGFPCPVATEPFLAPELYGIDLSQRPVFKPEHDWYAFAVQLFKALLMAHPYGGVHPTLPTLTARAIARVSVLDSAVQYPRIALKPEVLTDDLLHTFHQWFTRGQRGEFPMPVLMGYMAALVTCPNCGVQYPVNRPACPACTTLSPVPAIGQEMARAETLLQTGGKIIHWQVEGSNIAMIAVEGQKAVLYRYVGGRALPSLTLFDRIQGGQYALFGPDFNLLAVSPAPDSEDLFVLDVGGVAPVGLLKTATDSFGLAGPVFGGGRGALYRLAAGYLVRGERLGEELAERRLMATAENQTWFSAAPDGDRVVGYFRTLNTYNFFVYANGEQHEIALPPLETGGRLLNIAVKWAANSALIIQETVNKFVGGSEELRLTEIDLRGQIVGERRIANDARAADLAYVRDLVFFATDKGIERLTISTGARKAFPQVEQFTRQGDGLHIFEDGLLLIREDRVMRVRL